MTTRAITTEVSKNTTHIRNIYAGDHARNVRVPQPIPLCLRGLIACALSSALFLFSGGSSVHVSSSEILFVVFPFSDPFSARVVTDLRKKLVV